MLESALQPSQSFKKSANQSVFAIVLFAVTYLILVLAALSITLFCAYLGITLIIYYTSYLTILLGAGLIVFGFLILFFLVKFIFKSNKIDRSNLIEITRSEEPLIFEMLDDLVKTVQTDFPKHIYLSAEVNASVFYDSSFWSMFFPVRKNLLIGMGLVNTCTIDELKSVLAHEFGHFSQKSLKVGSYVYMVNKIIDNILYENNNYNQIAGTIAGSNNFLSLFVWLSDKVVQGMQYLLNEVYRLLNKNYSKLSHEMEYHADAVAAYTVGAKPLIDTLLRMQLASNALHASLNYYDRNLGVATKNIFPNQTFVMNFMASQHHLPIENDFPQVDLKYYNRHNKSKLSLVDLYSSHPETEDRIKRMEALGAAVKFNQKSKAESLFKHWVNYAERLTTVLYAHVQYPAAPNQQSLLDFEKDYSEQNKKYTYPLIFQDYFDYRNPFTNFKEEDFLMPTEDTAQQTDYFSEEVLSLNYELKALREDLITIQNIQNKQINCKTFNYNGQLYSNQDCEAMIQHLNEEIEALNNRLLANDHKIFTYLLGLAQKQNQVLAFKNKAETFKQAFERFNLQQDIYDRLMNAAAFIMEQTPFEVIRKKISILKQIEEEFKTEIKSLLESDTTDFIAPDVKQRLNDYLAVNLKYFGVEEYFNDELTTFYTAANDFLDGILTLFFHAKKDYLIFSEKLMQPSCAVV